MKRKRLQPKCSGRYFPLNSNPFISISRRSTSNVFPISLTAALVEVVDPKDLQSLINATKNLNVLIANEYLNKVGDSTITLNASIQKNLRMVVVEMVITMVLVGAAVLIPQQLYLLKLQPHRLLRNPPLLLLLQSPTQSPPPRPLPPLLNSQANLQ